MIWPFRKADVEPEPELTTQQKLVEAQAELARAQELEPSEFTIYPTVTSPLIRHGVDEKPKQIARLKGRIAYLKVKANEETK